MGTQGRWAILHLNGEKAKMMLLEKEAPKTCNAFWSLLPLESYAFHAKFAGDEFFFMIPKILELENVKEFSAGDVAYYPLRQTVCIFYGKIKPFGGGRVSVFAKITENLEAVQKFGEKLKAAGPGSMKVKVEKGE